MPKVVSNIVEAYVYRCAAAGHEFLVLRRSRVARMAGTWHTVYGHVRPGETAFDAAQRELVEETRLAAECWHQLERLNLFFMADRDEIHLCPGFAAGVGSHSEPVLNHEHDAHEWLAPDEAMQRFHWPGQADAVRQIGSLILPGGPRAESLRLVAG